MPGLSCHSPKHEGCPLDADLSLVTSVSLPVSAGSSVPQRVCWAPFILAVAIKKRRKNLLWFSLGFVSLIAGRWGGKRQQPLTFPGAMFVFVVAGASSTSCPHRGAHHISSLKNTRPQRPVFCWDFFVTWLDSHCPINHPPLFDTQQIYGSGLMKPKGN